MQTPVEHGDEKRLLSALVIVGPAGLLHVGVAIVVVHGFGDAIVEEADTDATREKHREPAEVVVLGRFVVLAELHAAVLAEGNPEEEHDPGVLGADVQPGKILGDPRLPFAKFGRSYRTFVDAVNHKAPKSDRRKCRDHPI